MNFSGMGGEIRFAVKVQNEEKLKQLNADIKKQQDAIRALTGTLNQGAGAQARFFQSAAPHAAQLKTLTAEVARLQHGIKSVDPGRMGLGLMAVGNMVDDMQYGFRSIVNNIPQVVYLMGGSAGLAGGAAIAAVAVNQLVERWGQMTDMMRSAWLNVPADHLEKLRIRAEKATEAFDKLMKAPSKLEDTQIGILQDAITGADRGGAAMVFKGLTEAVAASPVDRAQLDPADQAELDRLRRAAKGNPFLERRLAPHEAQANKKLDDANRKKAADIMGEALQGGEEGVSARATMARLIKDFPASFPGGLAGAVSKASPEEVERLDQEHKQVELLEGISKILERDERQRRSGADHARAGGPPATADQIRRMLEDSGLQYKFGPEAMKRTIKEMVGAGLNKDQAREAISLMPWLLGQDRTMAERLMQGPVGRKMMMGGLAAPQAGPVTEEQAMGMLRGHPLFGRMNVRAKGQMARKLAGLDQGQAQEVLAGITGQAMAKNAGRFGGNQFNALVDLLDEGVAGARKKGPGAPAEDPLARAIGDQLKESGEAGDPRAIARQMREQFGQQVKRTMNEQGVNRQTAQFLAAQQNAMAAFPQLNQPAQWMGLAQKAKSIATNSLNLPNQLPDLARQQLKELTAIRAALADMARKATAPPPPGKLP